MRDTIFQRLIAMLQTVTKFQGEDGTVRVYYWPTSAPSGYPYVVVGSESLESTVLDNARDSRRYNFLVQIVGEKFGQEGGMLQADALKAMRDTEDQVLSLFDNQNALGTSFVIRTFPSNAKYGLTDNNARVVYTLELRVDTMVNVTL